ncbi:carbonic anhydrase [Saccharothrix coeruleofusca]|uniref:carbonic anhydrase n=1 Tax=Saccharothrix coeruleofusca TaxID=33919 RepID=A0A918EFQ3_9PSEU|nr:carbonic anhydrase [Saccharothrix coeruleofusca]GGP65937.1 carbonic anhydrase [Saccharothrix coeruleofusca]
MTEFHDLLERNREFASTTDLRLLEMPDPARMPERMPLVLTCVDPRVEPAGFLGLRTGDAGVLRNVGGRVDDRIVEDIAYLAMRLGVRLDVAVIHHTQCGSGLLADHRFRGAFAERTGADEEVLAARAVTEPSRTVRHDVRRLLASPLITGDAVATASGHVLKLETGLVETIIAAAAPGEPASD